MGFKMSYFKEKDWGEEFLSHKERRENDEERKNFF